MSFFVAYQPDTHDGQMARFVERAAANGFEIASEYQQGTLRIAVFPALSGIPAASHTEANGDFALALGSLIHDGIASPACLPQMLQRFDADTFAWQGMLGTHTVLLRKQGRLYVFGDGLGATRLYTNADGTLWSNSYLAMLEIARPKRLDRQACLEYVIAGSVYGDKSMTEGIRSLSANSLLTFDPSGTAQERHLPSPIRSDGGGDFRSLDDWQHFEKPRP